MIKKSRHHYRNLMLLECERIYATPTILYPKGTKIQYKNEYILLSKMLTPLVILPKYRDCYNDVNNEISHTKLIPLNDVRCSNIYLNELKNKWYCKNVTMDKEKEEYMTLWVEEALEQRELKVVIKVMINFFKKVLSQKIYQYNNKHHKLIKLTYGSLKSLNTEISLFDPKQIMSRSIFNLFADRFDQLCHVEENNKNIYIMDYTQYTSTWEDYLYKFRNENNKYDELLLKEILY